ncbi:MAG: Tar ligand binding domain-containing protein, partial [Rhodanobacter sp.]
MKMPSFKFKFSSLTIRARLIAQITLLGAMLLGGAAIGLGSMSLQNEGTRHIYEEEMVPAQMVGNISTDSLKSFIVLGEAAAVIGKADPMKQKLAEFDHYQNDLNDLKKHFSALPMSPAVAAAFKDYSSSDQDYIQARDDVLDALKKNDPSVSDSLEMEVRPLLM